MRVQAFSSYDSGKSSTASRPDNPCMARVVRHAQMADELTSAAGAMTSPADEDHVTGERADDGSCSPSSVTIVDLDAATTDAEDDDRPPGDGGVDEPGRPPTLRVPTPSSWEKYRVVASPQRHSAAADTGEPSAGDVKVVVLADRRNDLLKDDVDRRAMKKPCSCGAVSTEAQVNSSCYVEAADYRSQLALVCVVTLAVLELKARRHSYALQAWHVDTTDHSFTCCPYV